MYMYKHDFKFISSNSYLIEQNVAMYDTSLKFKHLVIIHFCINWIYKLFKVLPFMTLKIICHFKKCMNSLSFNSLRRIPYWRQQTSRATLRGRSPTRIFLLWTILTILIWLNIVIHFIRNIFSLSLLLSKYFPFWDIYDRNFELQANYVSNENILVNNCKINSFASITYWKYPSVTRYEWTTLDVFWSVI